MLEEAWQDFLEAARREWNRSQTRHESEYPHFTEGDKWRLLSVEARSRWIGDFYDHGNWTAGFWFGVMWLLSLGTDDPDAARLAQSRLRQLVPRVEDCTTHDLGFLFYPGFVLGHETGFVNEIDVAPALRAAEALARRFNQRGDFIQAFGPIGDPRSAGTSTIDTMMNLPLLWWASAHGGTDPVLFDVARRHARTSARLFLREDGSTYHLNRFDPVSGALLHRGTYQGAAQTSCWSRGQAWAICGFAWAFAAAGEIEFLSAAERAAAYFWNRIPPDGVPPWDFSDRAPEAPPDASASAIAGLGALVLGWVHPDEAARGKYTDLGAELLSKLSVSCLNRDSKQDGILLRSCYSKPHGLGVDGATAWGDFFFGLGLALATEQVSLSSVLGFPVTTWKGGTSRSERVGKSTSA